jgi:exopolysaccharide biosynthesis polyprenyl glycosylphosphotransferase
MNNRLLSLEVYRPFRKLLVLSLDFISIVVAFFLASVWRLNVAPNFLSTEFIGILVIIVLSLFVSGAYSEGDIRNVPKMPFRTFFAVVASSLPATLFIYALGPDKFTGLFGRGIFPVAIIILGALSVVVRVVVNNLFTQNKKQRKIILLGNSSNEVALDNYLVDQVQFLIQKLDDLDQVQVKQGDVDAIVISPNHHSSFDEQQLLIEYRLAGVPIFSLSDFFESHLFLVPVEQIKSDWFIRTQGFSMLHNSLALRGKRLADIFVAVCLLIVTFPIQVVVACLIKASSAGPIYFNQVRVGLKGEEFLLRKFRTMIIDAESKGAQWASNNDPRITGLGRFLRKSRIDELPQCWNILKGEMSIIGPRPERPEFTSSLREEIPYYDLRHIVKPGISGWAQVMYPYGASREDALHKLQYDLFYIKHQSLLLDLNILLRTIKIVVRQKGR